MWKNRSKITQQGVFMNTVIYGKPAKHSVRKRLCPRTSNVSSNFSFLQDIMPLYEIHWLGIHLQWSLVLWLIFIFNIIIYCDSILYYFLPEIMTCVYEIQSLYIKHILWWENPQSTHEISSIGDIWASPMYLIESLWLKVRIQQHH